MALIGEGTVLALARLGVESQPSGRHVAQRDRACLGVDAADLGYSIARATGVALGQGERSGVGDPR